MNYQELVLLVFNCPERDDEAGFAKKTNEMPKYVVSTTLERPDWQNTTVLSGDPASAIAALRDEIDGVILVAGSATLVRTLVENDLADELRLVVFPVLLGRGKRLFPEGETKRALKLIEAKTVGDGVAILRCERPQ